MTTFIVFVILAVLFVLAWMGHIKSTWLQILIGIVVLFLSMVFGGLILGENPSPFASMLCAFGTPIVFLVIAIWRSTPGSGKSTGSNTSNTGASKSGYVPRNTAATNVVHPKPQRHTTATSSVSLNPQEFPYFGSEPENYLFACYHDGIVYSGKTPSEDHIIGYYQSTIVENLEHRMIGSICGDDSRIQIIFSTAAIDLSMIPRGLRSSASPDGWLAEILGASGGSKYQHITDYHTVVWLADYQGDPRGAAAALVCLIYEMHRGVINSKYSRFYDDYIASFHK